MFISVFAAVLHLRLSWASWFLLELRNYNCSYITPLWTWTLHLGRASSVRRRDWVHITPLVTRLFILSRVQWLDTGFGLVIGFIGLLQTMATINYSRFIKRCLITAPNTIYSSASVFTSLLVCDCLITRLITATPGHLLLDITGWRLPVDCSGLYSWPPYLASPRISQKTLRPWFLYCCVRVSVTAETCLSSHSPATAVPAFIRHVRS
jgi:hypothetical protein